MVDGGKPLHYLDTSPRHSYPLVMHGVSLSIGSGDHAGHGLPEEAEGAGRAG